MAGELIAYPLAEKQRMVEVGWRHLLCSLLTASDTVAMLQVATAAALQR